MDNVALAVSGLSVQDGRISYPKWNKCVVIYGGVGIFYTKNTVPVDLDIIDSLLLSCKVF